MTVGTVRTIFELIMKCNETGSQYEKSLRRGIASFYTCDRRLIIEFPSARCFRLMEEKVERGHHFVSSVLMLYAL